MQRCIALAQLGCGFVSPNPMVGAVLVYNNRIIGEGYHQQYGAPHAEVQCINSVNEQDKPFIKQGTLYVSLEPCNHFGKTPPCSNLIVQHCIPNVVVGCRDSNSLVNGAGIAFLKENGVNVIENVLNEECLKLNATFFFNQKNKKPYVTLKWAQSKDGFMNTATPTRTLITNEITNRVVHKVRSENDAILIGSNTLLIDNPFLNNRHYGTKQPIKIIIDRQLKAFATNKNIAIDGHCIVVNSVKNATENNIQYIQVREDEFFIDSMLQQLYALGIGTLLVEGGSTLLQLFIQKKEYQKVICITNDALQLQNGLAAPTNWDLPLQEQRQILSDTVSVYY